MASAIFYSSLFDIIIFLRIEGEIEPKQKTKGKEFPFTLNISDERSLFDKMDRKSIKQYERTGLQILRDTRTTPGQKGVKQRFKENKFVRVSFSFCSLLLLISRRPCFEFIGTQSSELINILVSHEFHKQTPFIL